MLEIHEEIGEGGGGEPKKGVVHGPNPCTPPSTKQATIGCRPLAMGPKIPHALSLGQLALPLLWARPLNFASSVSSLAHTTHKLKENSRGNITFSLQLQIDCFLLQR
jgi:hypothetical protein